MSKTVLFQTIQFSIQRLFHFKQLSYAYVRSINAKTVLIQAIQFCINTQFSVITLFKRQINTISSNSV